MEALKKADHAAPRIRQIQDVAAELRSHIDGDGYIRASNTYPGYHACWFRDAAMVSISLTETARFLHGKYAGADGAASSSFTSSAQAAKECSARVLNFCFDAVEANLERINGGITTSLNDPAFFDIHNHLPARIGKNRQLFRLDETDTSDADNYNIWLRQYDSLPLLLMAAERHVNAFGHSNLKSAMQVIEKNADTFLQYMAKVYNTPCSSIWEMNHSDQIHSCTVASIYSGIDSINRLSRRMGFGMDNSFAEKSMTEVDRFISDFFIRDNILYRAKKVFNGSGFESEPMKEIDSCAIIALNHFKVPSITGKVERNTMIAIDKELFNGEMLPVRFKGDTYFTGGRWLLLGLEAAQWHLRNRDADRAEKIVKYVENKYLARGGALPEQELVASESNHDPEGYLAKNHGKVIEDLAWSEAAYLIAAVSIERRNVHLPGRMENMSPPAEMRDLMRS